MDEKVALVLSGGGSRGAYQIGVWKALRKLKIKIDIVTGTSVGALNGLMVVQNDYRRAIKIWSNVDQSFVFKNFDIDKYDKKKIYLKYIEYFIKDGGMDVSNLENQVSKVYNEFKFKKSPINYGIATFNFTKLKPQSIIKKELNNKNIKDYVIASATCFPAFKMKNIKGEKYIDGAYSDYIPISLSVDLGATKVYAVDLNAIGIRNKIPIGVKVINIKPKNDIGPILLFDSEQSKKNIKYGYNDTLKIFNKLHGKKFSFFHFMYNKCFEKYEAQFKEKIDKVNLLKIIEMSGDIFNIDDSKKYILPIYNSLLKRKIKKVENVKEKFTKSKIDNKNFLSLLNKKTVVKYIYEEIKKDNLSKIKRLKMIFPDEYLVALYISII